MPFEADLVPDLMRYLDASPTPQHAVAVAADRLIEAGFTELDIEQPWDAVPERGVVRRDGALLAWRVPAEWTPSTGLRIIAAHSDSPTLRLKPKGGYLRAGFQQANVEVYGGPLLATWFDRDLAVAGPVVDLGGQVHLVHTEPLARVSNLAIHLDRDALTGAQIDPQRDLMVSWGLGSDADLVGYVASQAGLGADDVAGFELSLVPTEPAALLGADRELLASWRQDNLLSVHAGLSAMLAAAATDDAQLFVVYDHEEVGSHTVTGASGALGADLLRRLSVAHGYRPDDHRAWLARGWQVSSDVAHGLHPNRPDRHDPVAWPLLGGGPVLKWSAKARYGTDATSMAIWTRACRAAGVASQVFVNNNTVPGGSSLGPLAATRLGVRTVDVGTPILSMHSIRELSAPSDQVGLTRVMREFLQGA